MAVPETVNMHEAKTHLSRLVARVENGEEIVIAKAGRPVARIIPMPDVRTAVPKERTFGWLRGQFVVPDDIKTPFAKEIEEMFYGEDEAAG